MKNEKEIREYIQMKLNDYNGGKLMYIEIVYDLQEFCKYLQTEALRQGAVSGRSEQLVCSICNGKGKYIDTHPERYGEVKCKCGAK